ncbi:hypothetical protein ILFOPFJJ_03904 [Ensifer psoraleae]|uniref:hypothetical protein n=1 Tax=Sinorhizobium psoraleae TaxID=520838 RepID=UPI001FEC74DC|nr:hypothetical protein [Sinorhizobium psoraleae]NRP73005.1 hypothetical protein [Sinorhizobium psoraleae]
MPLNEPQVRSDGLQVEEHRQFQEAFWSAERLAWLGFASVLVLVILGLSGSGGIFSKQATRFQEGTAEFPRFSRWEAPEAITALLSAREQGPKVTISREFFRSFRVETIHPAPVSAEAGDHGMTYHFHSVPGQDVLLTLHVRPYRPGIASYRVGINREPVQDVRTIVWP